VITDFIEDEISRSFDPRPPELPSEIGPTERPLTAADYLRFAE
jgi:hypothetical protein